MRILRRLIKIVLPTVSWISNAFFAFRKSKLSAVFSTSWYFHVDTE